jgi:Tfp pilus assembly protein PilF
MAERAVGDEVAGRYVIEREIGRGGMGAVYAARDQRLGRRVALKTMGDRADEHVRQRLEIEARAVASIEHPGIVTLYDVVEDRGETVLVMELVAGQTLREILKMGALAREEVARIVYEVSDALAAAHAQKLVHRDVKPDNVMLRTDGRVALLDFGVAKQTEGAGDPTAATTTGEGVIVGTPAYLAPEQAHAQPLGPAADQFALAVTAYELLTRELPWPTTTSMLMVAAIVSSDPKPLVGFDPTVGAVIARALAKKPGDRYASVTELADALGAALGVARPSRPRSLVPDAASSGSVPAPTSPSGRGPSTLEIGATLRATERQLSAARPRRSRARAAAVAGAVVVLAAGIGFFARHRARRAHAPPASVAPEPLAIADVSADDTTNATARAKVHEAMGALSVGRGNAAVFALLDEAMTADPDCGSAALQRAFASFRLAGPLDPPGRRAFRIALEHHRKMSARNADFLDALGPSFADPPDWNESGKRLEAMLVRRPGDAEAWEALGILRYKSSELAAADGAFTHENAVDPNAYTPYFLRGFLRANHGDVGGANRMFAECIERLPATIECRRAVVTMDRAAGDCAAADRVAREAAALAPEAAAVYGLRAATAASLGAPREAVAALLAQKRAHEPAAQRALEQANDDYALAMRAGDFGAALAALDAADRQDDSGRLDRPASLALERAGVLREMGEDRRAADVALAFLDRMSAYKLPEQVWDDPTGELLGVAEAGGRLAHADWVARRDAWIASWRGRLAPEAWRQDGVALWLGAWANVDEPSPARAKEAIASLSQFGDHQLDRYDPGVQAHDGRTGALFLAAGQVDEAVKHLESATRSCRIAPLVPAFLSLGRARALRGDERGACEAFEQVERSWGRAKPRSVTLEAARVEMKRHACAK